MRVALFFDDPRRQQRVAHVSLAVIQLCLLWAFAAPWSLIHGFPLDDAWIHQVVARTFAETGTLGYSAGHHGAGATSYLWAALLALNFKLFQADPVVFTLALNVVLSSCVGQLLLRFVIEIAPEGGGLHVFRSVLATALACSGGNFLWFAFSGMEANLLVVLVLLSTWLFASRRGNRSALGAGLAAAALALTRPEAGTHTLMLALLGQKLGRSRRETLRLLVPWAIGVAIYFGSNWLRAGTPLPATLSGRRWLWFEGSGGSFSLTWELVLAWWLRLRDYTLGTSATAVLWVSLGFCAWGIAWLVRRRARALLVILVWNVVHVLTYAVLMPTSGHGGRYQPFVPLLYLLTCALGSMAFVSDLAALVRRHRAVEFVAAAVAISPWVGIVSIGIRDWRSDHANAVVHVEKTECELGRAMSRLPADAAVASFDIGCSGFYAGRTVIDLGGLSDPSTVPLMKEGRIWEYMRDKNVRFVALPLAYLDEPDLLNFAFRLNLDGNPAVALETIREFQTPLDVWLPGARATQHAAPRQGLYAVTFTGKPAYWSKPPADAPPLSDPDHRLPTERRVQDGLRMLAGAGAKVDLGIVREKPALMRGERWQIALGAWGVAIAPPSTSPITNEQATSIAVDLAERYVVVDDWDGAARACLHAVSISIRRWVDPSFRPRLVGLGAPEGPERNTPRSTLPWGIPLALFVFGLAFALRRRLEKSNGS